MDQITSVGIDLAKKVFDVTAVDANGAVVTRMRLRRAGMQSYLARLPRGCVVAMEACDSAHHRARQALRLGHRPVLINPHFVVPYVNSNKNDVNDADEIAEASSRPGMRFVGVKSVEQQHLQQMHRARQMAVPGIGVLTATALLAAVGDAKAFRNGGQMAAWLGLVPRQRSTGGRAKLLGINKRGDRYLRTLLIHGARSSLRFASRRTDRRSRRAVATEKRRGRNFAGVALVNKNARTAWALLTRGTEFDVEHLGRAA